MISKNMKKILSGTIIAMYLTLYIAPAGICDVAASSVIPGAVSGNTVSSIAPTTFQPRTTIQKPVLKGTAQPSALKLEGDISITKGNPKVNLSLRDSDVKQVLRMFADKAGLNIIFHDSVSGKVTLDLVNVPLNDAFRMVMQITNLTYYIDHNTMVVASATEAQKLNLAKQEIMTIPVKYLDAAALADFLNKNIFSINSPGLSNAQIAITNPSTNEILIFGTQNDFLMAKKIVAQFDKKPLEQTYTVKHTTPKEMSDLLCNVLFKNLSSAATSSGGGGGGGGGSDLSLGAGTVACQFKNTVTAGDLTSLNINNLSITYFAQLGTISVMGGSAEQMDLVKSFIAKNDVKQPQAYLELSIIELNESGTKEFDNTWQIWSNFFTGTFTDTTQTNSYYPNFIKGDSYTVYDSTAYPPVIKKIVTPYTGPMVVTYSMNYILQNQKGRVLANPKILITNGQLSTIDLSSDYVKTVTSQVLTSAGSLTPTIQRTYSIGSDEGIKVDMTPFISPDGYVTLNIKPQYSTEKEKVYAPNPTDPDIKDLQATLLQRRNLDLKNVRIKDGETLVIGGMISENEHKTTSKIPVLADLPGVGFFFRSTQTTKTRSELVIMITPKIIKDSEDIVKNSDTTL